MYNYITMKNILVTGSKGYIGSHAVRLLESKGYNVIGLDLLHNSGVNDTKSNEVFYEGDIRNDLLLDEIFMENKIDLVMHFGGLISVPESVEKPELYFDVNHNGTKELISAMKRNGVDKIIFSSTAATYGNPESLPIKEEDLQKPINPYGESKLKAEKEIIESGLTYSIFRYFNVAGSIGDGLGYFPKQSASHLIPLINDVANDSTKVFKIFGNDYKTEDGTCVRDYVHVQDLVEAHVMAVEKMFEDNYQSNIFNISSGKGYSVKEVYDTACKVHGKEIPVEILDRRAGDPDLLIASSDKLQSTFGWTRKYNLEDMIKSDFEARYK